MSVVVEGVGETEYSRASGRSTGRLAFEAILAAANDAEIETHDIDGIISYPNSIGAEEIAANLRLKRLSYSSFISMGGASAVASLGHARLAVEAGVARHVLILRARNGNSALRVKDRPSVLPSQEFRRNLEFPLGWNTPAQRYAMICRRYMAERGLTRTQLGSVACSARRHAQLNPRAQMYGKTLTIDQYLGGRLIADPYTLYDCCLETDGACAVIVGSSTTVRRPAGNAVVLSVADDRPETPDDLSNRPDLLAIGLDVAAERAWQAAGVGPADMDGAMIYDCFTFEVIHQLEAAGFVGPGAGGRFVENGNIDLGGKLPVNTHGGLLSEGHMSGLNHVVEAVRQLRGEAKGRQIEGARHIAVTGWGDLGDGSMAVLGQGR
jgi:acetyl-CoA acetyltransferase